MPRKYKYLLMDADDTILDFKRCEHDALKAVLDSYGLPSGEDVIEIYSEINDRYWKLLELGRITKSALTVKRYETFIEKMGFDVKPEDMSDAYVESLSRQMFLLPGALETLSHLHGLYEIYIITNGIESVQKARMSICPVRGLVDGIFISGEIGHEKPSAEFFDAVAQKIPGFDRSRALIVGDSLTSDMKGGVTYGIDTCWLNPKGKSRPENMDITYEISDIRGLEKVLGEESCVTSELTAELDKYGIKYVRDLIMAQNSTFRIGGPADIALFPETPGQLETAVRLLRGRNLRYTVTGNASNLLFADAGFRGALVCTGSLKGIKTDDEACTVTAAAGEMLVAVCRQAAEAGLSGAEGLFGIPATVGGAVCMNGGAYGYQISEILESCVMLDTASGCLRSFTNTEMNFSYRHSLVSESGKYIVVSAVFRLKKGKKEEISAAMADYMSRRRSRQPTEHPSAGSVFKRPAPDIYVGKLIDDLGLRGYSIGGAQISEKHAGFIINTGNALASDVISLTEYIRKRVYEAYGISLESEIIRVPER